MTPVTGSRHIELKRGGQRMWKLGTELSMKLPSENAALNWETKADPL